MCCCCFHGWTCKLPVCAREFQRACPSCSKPLTSQINRKVRTCLLRSIWSARRGLTWELFQRLLHVSLPSHLSATASWGINSLPTYSSLEASITTWWPAAVTDIAKVWACHLTGPFLWRSFGIVLIAMSDGGSRSGLICSLSSSDWRIISLCWLCATCYVGLCEVSSSCYLMTEAKGFKVRRASKHGLFWPVL